MDELALDKKYKLTLSKHCGTTARAYNTQPSARGMVL